MTAETGKTPLFLVRSDPTGEFALPNRAGWTVCREDAGLYSLWGAERASQLMVGGPQFATSIVPADQEEVS